MKTIVTTFAFSLALCAAAGATARTQSAAPAPAADSVLLSETTDGDYLVRRFIIRSGGDADYTVRYKINLATLDAALNGNPKQLDELNTFLDNLVSDTLIRVKTANITGYASPDGPVQFNESLAARRARDFRNYVDKKYDFSEKYDVTLNSVAEDWETCRRLVSESQMADKQAVLRIIDGSQSPEQKEQALKRMTAAWDYMKRNILPPLRRVELAITYRRDNIVEQRMLIPRPEPAPEPETVCVPCPCEVVDEHITGIIVEMPETEHEYRKELREERRVLTADERAAEKIARRELREAKRIERQNLKAAKKIARKEAKAAKKAEKAARKTYKEMENM